MEKLTVTIATILIASVVAIVLMYNEQKDIKTLETIKIEVAETTPKTTENITPTTEGITILTDESEVDQDDLFIQNAEVEQVNEIPFKNIQNESIKINETYTIPKEDNIEEKTETIKEPTHYENESSDTKEPINSTTQEKKEIWEELGITEDDYFNKPANNWAKIDFQTMEECLVYGDNYKSPNGEGFAFNCREVTSLSGKFLGVMFEVEFSN